MWWNWCREFENAIPKFVSLQYMIILQLDLTDDKLNHWVEIIYRIFNSDLQPLCTTPFLLKVPHKKIEKT